ncbi:Krueppel-like factor 17 [Meriones unguiculatus]|uniref:Krueppel-like factor 17 n=1 Tax=Meriones unguiculatus TaxID=10047 RepID=UPI000B4F62ED|nr:Krueppel-like factor 17 [Meriones unguiculatus]
MEQDDEWQAVRQSPTDNETLTSVSNAAESSGNVGVDEPAATQHLTEMLRPPMVVTEEFRHSEGEGESQILLIPPEHGVRYPAQLTPTPSQIYCQTPIGQGSHTVPIGSLGPLGVAISFSENLMPIGGLPGSASCGVSVMAHSSVPIVVPVTTGSLKHGILLVPSMPSTMTHAVGHMVHSLNPCDLGLPPARHQPLLSLESQDSLGTQSNFQEEPVTHEQPTPAPQEREAPSTSGIAAWRRSSISRPHVCSFNCGKSYTKRSHLVCHERKHRGVKPYVCDWEGCTWSFFRSDELGRHRRIHTRDRPHRCGECGRHFMRSDHLKQHQKTHRRGRDLLRPPANNGQIDGQTDGGPLEQGQGL